MITRNVFSLMKSTDFYNCSPNKNVKIKYYFDLLNPEITPLHNKPLPPPYPYPPLLTIPHKIIILGILKFKFLAINSFV